LKFKLDENLGRLARALLEAAGHDVATVHGEDLCSASDDRVIEASLQEERCLVTLDLEFGNPLRYRASNYAGIAVLRLPDRPSPEHLENAVRTLIAGLQPTIARHVWIIEAGRIRVYQDPDEDPLGDGFEGDSEA
jgi:predicted nuclease of predicted toxin-antitoxin system